MVEKSKINGDGEENQVSEVVKALRILSDGKIPLKYDEAASLYKDGQIQVNMSLEDFNNSLIQSKASYVNSLFGDIRYDQYFLEMEDSNIYIRYADARVAQIDESKIDDINLYRVVRDVMVENADSYRINKTLYCFN